MDYSTYASLSATSTETINLKDGNVVKIVTTKNAVSNYDYEDEQNESKREIKILDKRYVSQIENELYCLIVIKYIIYYVVNQVKTFVWLIDTVAMGHALKHLAWSVNT